MSSTICSLSCPECAFYVEMGHRRGLRHASGHAILRAGVRDCMSSGAFFVSDPTQTDRRRSIPARKTGMVSSDVPAKAGPQLKTDPANSGRAPAAWHRRPLGRRQHHGAPAARSASPPGQRSSTGRPGELPTALALALAPLTPRDTVHLDNRRFVKTVGWPHEAQPATASSHTARCAAAGRRSGDMLSWNRSLESSLDS